MTFVLGIIGCSNDVCKNGGTCYIFQSGDLNCACPATFTGTRCETGRPTSTYNNVPASSSCSCIPKFNVSHYYVKLCKLIRGNFLVNIVVVII